MKRCDFFPQSISDSSESVFVSVKNGLKIVYDIVEIRKPLTVMSFLSLVIMPYAFLMPQIVNQRFSGGPQELGFAMSASGLGALIGAFYLAWRKNVNGLYKLIKYSMILAGIGLVSLAFITNLYVAIPFLILTGISSFIIVAGTNTIMQTFVPQQFRGRVMSIFTVAFFGLAPVGSLISGQIASFAGAHNTVAAGGFLAVVVMFSEIVYKKIRKS
jgi:MFS family permease